MTLLRPAPEIQEVVRDGAVAGSGAEEALQGVAGIPVWRAQRGALAWTGRSGEGLAAGGGAR